MSNDKIQISNIKCQMPNVNKVKLMSERTFGAPPVIFLALKYVGPLHALHLGCDFFTFNTYLQILSYEHS